MYLLYFSEIQVCSTIEAEKLGYALTLLPSREIDLGNFDFAVDQMRTNYKYNESVTNSLLQLCLNCNGQLQSASLRKWIQDLPAIITSARVNIRHLEATKSLLKRRDETLIHSFGLLSTVPNEQSKVRDQVWRTLALCPKLNIPKEMTEPSLQRVSVSTRQFVLCSAAM